MLDCVEGFRVIIRPLLCALVLCLHFIPSYFSLPISDPHHEWVHQRFGILGVAKTRPVGAGHCHLHHQLDNRGGQRPGALFRWLGPHRPDLCPIPAVA